MLSLSLLLIAQIAAAAQVPAVARDDSVYASARLEALLDEASRRNRVLPPTLRGYDARVRGEIAVIVHRSDGAESAVQIEETESVARWQRPGAFEQHVVGYRLRALALNLSVVGGMRTSWTVPLLYGNSLDLWFGAADSARRARRARKPPRDTISAVHPLSIDRERYYRFTGGDTVSIVRIDGRRIPIVRVDVVPRGSLPRRTALFRGELDLDATRRQIVRMRGRFVLTGGKRGLGERLLQVGVGEVAYVELVNAEVEGRYWLPSYQRIEFQLLAPATSEARAIVRMISRFRDYTVSDLPDERRLSAGVIADSAGTTMPDASADSIAIAAGDTLVMARHRLTLASTDSLSRFDAWHGEIGREAAGTSGDDFDDIAPDRWRTTGPPRLDLRTERFADLFHFDRIEGAYTGFGAVVRLRDAAPGLSARATAGWAWSEQTIRGRAGATWRRGPWMLGALGGRGLDITNDFHSPFDSGSTLGALLSQDDYDYVDRRFATLSVARELGGRNGTVLRLAAGPASDHRARRHVKRGLWPSDSTFRENRGVDEGSYARSAASIEYHPDVNIEFVRPGVGALLSYERGDGALDWQRAEGRLVARRGWRAFTVATRLDAGVVLGDRPPQQLFELGEEGRLLPGYRYKEFAGDQAVSLRTMALYDLPYLRSPIRVGRRLLPSPAPALWVGAQSGWTGASGNVARQSIRRLGDRRDPKTGVALLDPITGLPLPVSRLTGGVRTSVDLGLRFFGGAVGLGVARAVDHEARWRFEVSFVQEM